MYTYFHDLFLTAFLKEHILRPENVNIFWINWLTWINMDHISSSLAKAGMKKKILQLSRNESSLQVGKKGLTDVEENVYETKFKWSIFICTVTKFTLSIFVLTPYIQ